MIFTKILNTALWWSVTLLVSSFYIYGSNINGKYGMMILTAVIAGLCILRYGKNLNLHITRFHLSILTFATFCLLSSLWSIVPEESIQKSLSVFQILICMSVVYIYAEHQSSVLPLLDSIRWAGYLMVCYLFIVYGWSELQILLQDNMRIDSELINSNVIGMVVAFSLVLTLYRWIYVKFSLSYLFAIPELLLLSLSGSKKGFFILLLGSMGVFLLKYTKQNIFKFLLRGVGALAIGIVIISAVCMLPIFEELRHRLERLLALLTGQGIVDGSSMDRSLMIRIGLEQFFHTPILGLGIGGSGEITLRTFGWSTYLHNNYVELLSCAGIVGTLIYYWMFLRPGILLARSWRGNNQNSKMCFILLILFLFTDVAVVSYYSKQTYFFILLFHVQAMFQMKENKAKYGH